MNAEQLQFVFSLFSLVGVIGVLFYIILEKGKVDERNEKFEALENEVSTLKEYVYTYEKRLEEKEDTELSSPKEQIISLYEEGVNLMEIENRLKVPKATIEMVLKFHNLNKSDNWRESVDNNL